MFRRHPDRGAGRGVIIASALCLAVSLPIAGCGDFKKTIGLEPTLPDEFAVESRAPLTIPPDFDLRPPSARGPTATGKGLKPAGQAGDRAGRAGRAG